MNSANVVVGSLPQRTRPVSRRGRARGFTLIELITVVLIMSILAVFALGNFRQRMTQAGTIEVRAMIKSIAAAQESYRGENLVYLDVSDEDLSSLYPMTVPDGTDYSFGGWSSHTDHARWELLAPETPTAVSFGYATVAGLPGFDDWSNLNSGVTATWPTTLEPWYLIRAVGDDDGNGTTAMALASSFNSKIYWENEGE